MCDIVSTFEFIKNHMQIKIIDNKIAVPFIRMYHYSNDIPRIVKAFGWYDNDILMAVCAFSKPATPAPCIQTCGKEYADSVYELSRLCRRVECRKQLSQFVSGCLRKLKIENWIILSYADMGMNHHGYIYQACNFLYTGCSRARKDGFSPNGIHQRHLKADVNSEFRRLRTPKHRYIYFCTNNKKLKQRWAEALTYPILPYPKGDNNPNYKPGTVAQDIVIPTGAKNKNYKFYELKQQGVKGF